MKIQKSSILFAFSMLGLFLSLVLLPDAMVTIAHPLVKNEPARTAVAAVVDLSVTAGVGGPVSPYQEVTYYIDYAVSDEQAADVMLIFELPYSVIVYDGTTYTYMTDYVFASHEYQYEWDPRRISWQLGDVPAGTVGQELVIVRFWPGALDGSVFDSRAYFEYTGGDIGADAPSLSIQTTAAVEIDKGPSTSCTGQDLVYNISVQNNGSSDLFNLVITDNLPPGVTVVTATLPFQQTGPQITWQVPHLEYGSSAWFDVTVDTSGVVSNTISNQVGVTSDQGASDSYDLDTTFEIPELYAGFWNYRPSFIRPGDTFVYCLDVNVYPDCPMSDVTLTDTLPVGLAFISATLPHTEIGSQIVWNPASIGQPYMVTVRADDSLLPGDSITNHVAASAPGAGSDESWLESSVTGSLFLDVQKYMSQWGDSSDFYITVDNLGTGPITNLDVIDKIPDNMVLNWIDQWGSSCSLTAVTIQVHDDRGAVSPALDDPGWYDYVGGDSSTARWVRWHIPSLSNDTLDLYFYATHADLTGNTAVNTAIFSSDSFTGTATATFRIPMPLDLDTHADTDMVSPETDFGFYIYYENTSGITVTNTVLTSTLAPTMTFVSASDGGSYNAATHQVVWPLGSLAHGQGGNRYLTVQVPRGVLDQSQVCHQVYLDTDEWNRVGPESACTTVVGTFAYRLTKDTVQRFYYVDDPVVYTLGYENLGDVTVRQLNIWDRLPDAMEFVTATTPNSETLYYSSSPSPVSAPPSPTDPSWQTSVMTSPTWLRWERLSPLPVDTPQSVQIVLQSRPGITVGDSITNTAIITGANLLPAQVNRHVTFTPFTYAVYLPLLPRSKQIDLIVQSLTTSPSSLCVGQGAVISVVIENVGSGTVDDPFWVDLYIDPDPNLVPPQVNQTWDMVGSEFGIAWLITQTLAPGESITLSSLQYETDFSRWWGYFTYAGDHILYAQVDSFNDTVSFGGVLETTEDNNVIGPVTVVITCPVVQDCSKRNVWTQQTGPVLPRPVPSR